MTTTKYGHLGAQLFYSGQWNDLDVVLNRDAVTVGRGVPNEGATSDATELALSVANADNQLSVRRPNSPLYKLVGRNTPIRAFVGLPFPGASNSSVTDTVSHVAPSVDVHADVASGILFCAWAAPDPGGTYTVPVAMNGAGGQFGARLAIQAARQVIGVSGPTGTRTATFTAPEDYVAASVFINGPTSLGDTFATPFTGSQILTSGSVGDWWVLFEAFASHPDTDFADELRPVDYPWDTDGGGWMTLADTGSVQIGDVDAEHIRLKVWAKRIKTTSLSHDVRVRGTGSDDEVGVLIRVNAADVDPWLIRATGEMYQLPPRRDKSGRDKWVPARAAGLLRRLGSSSEQPVSSPLRRFFLRTGGGVLAYWPCEVGAGATALEAATSNTEPGRVVGDVSPASFDDFTGSAPVPTLGGIGYLRFLVPPHAAGSEFHNMLFSVPSGGLPTGQQLMSVNMDGGEVARFELEYTTGSGGSLNLIAQDNEGVTLDQTGAHAFAVNGKRFYCQISLVNSGADLSVALKTWEYTGDELAPVLESVTDTFTGLNIGKAVRAALGAGNGDPDGLAVGHYAVATRNQIVFGLEAALTGHNGELATARFERLCRDAGVAVMLVGDPDQSTRMGPQRSGTLLELCRQCEQADGGIMYEPREALALALRSLYSLYNQPAVATIDASLGKLQDWQPLPDDLFVANDVTVQRIDGGATQAVQSAGPLNIGDPALDPDAAGRYPPVRHTLNLEADPQTRDHAWWRLWLGTQDQPRFPGLPISLVREQVLAADPALVQALACADPGDKIVITNPPDDLPPDDLQLLVLGSDETLAQDQWDWSPNTAPATPYTVATRATRINVPGVTITGFPTSTTAHLVPMPTGVQAGHMLLVVIETRAAAGSTIPATPAGWTQVAAGAGNFTVFAKIADGSESSTNVDFVTAVGCTAAAVALRITGAYPHTTDGIDVSTVATGTSAAPNSGTATAGWGHGPNMYIAAAGWRTNDQAASAQPAGYPGLAQIASGAGAGAGAAAGVAVVELSAVSHDPGAWTLAGSESWHAVTIAVRPAEVEPGATSRRDTAGSELASGIDGDDTSLSVATTTGPLWGVTGDANMHFPLDVGIGGERIRVTAISGASSPQTFTVTRNVNSLPTPKSHAAGAPVSLWQPAVRAL